MSMTVDAIVVGAGLSGLQTAFDLHQAGRKVIVLEARDRVGGKTYSVPRQDGKGLQENGAAWVNDTNQSHAWRWCQRLGLHTVVQNVGGTVASEDEDGVCHFFPFEELPKFHQADVEDITALRDHVEASSLNPQSFNQPNRSKLDSISFEQFCRDAGAGRRALQTATLWCRGTTGHDPCEVSALSFLEVARGGLGIVNLRYDGKDGAQHLRIVEGTQSISIGIAKLLPADSIRLNSPAETITKLSSKLYSVRTSNGQTLKSRKVIISIPGPAYKNITFDPPLPPQKTTYTATVRHGCYLKYICLFKTPFWRRQGSCGLAQSFRGPINHCRDTSVDAQDNFALTCFLTSTPGRRWLTLDDAQRQDAVLKQLASLFQVSYEAVQSEFLGSVTTDWMFDKWAGWGCPFAAPPPGTAGNGDDGEAVRQKFEGMYFVGTELTDEWRGYMEGALRSGERGARQVLEDLKGEGSRNETKET